VSYLFLFVFVVEPFFFFFFFYGGGGIGLVFFFFFFFFFFFIVEPVPPLTKVRPHANPFENSDHNPPRSCQPLPLALTPGNGPTLPPPPRPPPPPPEPPRPLEPDPNNPWLSLRTVPRFVDVKHPAHCFSPAASTATILDVALQFFGHSLRFFMRQTTTLSFLFPGFSNFHAFPSTSPVRRNTSPAHTSSGIYAPHVR